MLTIDINHHAILKNIHYHIEQHDLIILLGNNGSGKSTLLNFIHRHHQHSVALLNQDCNQSLFTTLTLYENFLLACKKQDKSRSFLKNYLRDFNPNLSEKLNSLVNQLSGGEKQAFALALCLLNPPSLLLLDEHTSALDPATAQQIMALTMNMIKLHNITCVLTTHQLDFALQYGNRVLMLKEGKVAKEINADEKRLLSKDELLGFYCH